MAVIYLAQNQINFKKYVGLTSLSLQERKHRHILASRSDDKNRLKAFQLALKKYGPENFKWYEVIECSQEQAETFERFFIKHFESRYENHGYNLTDGGEGNQKMSKECLCRMGKKQSVRVRKRKIEENLKKNIIGYQVTHPNGQPEYVEFIAEFAKEHGLSAFSMNQLSQKKMFSCNGYLCDTIYIDTKTNRPYIVEREPSSTSKKLREFEITHSNGFKMRTRFLTRFFEEHNLDPEIRRTFNGTSNYERTFIVSDYQIKILKPNVKCGIKKKNLK